MLQQLLNTPKNPNVPLYSYLPVSTSLQQQLKKQASALLSSMSTRNIKQTSKTQDFHEFVPNEQTQNIKSDLIMLKLKGFLDKRNITGRNQQLKNLPSKVQVGKMIEGDPFLAMKHKRKGNKGSQMTLKDFYLQLDRKEQFSTRKFGQIQRNKQRRKRISKKSIKNGGNNGKNRKDKKK